MMITKNTLLLTAVGNLFVRAAASSIRGTNRKLQSQGGLGPINAPEGTVLFCSLDCVGEQEGFTCPEICNVIEGLATNEKGDCIKECVAFTDGEHVGGDSVGSAVGFCTKKQQEQGC